MPKIPVLVCLLALSLTACQTRETRQDTAPDTIRKQARHNGGVIEIQPLQEPAIRTLVQQARQYEAQGQYRWALKRVRQALQLAPGHPELLQHLAELLLQQGHADLALAYARDSWQRGPRVGPLCQRNWLTMARAHQLENHPRKAQEAQRQAQRCVIQPGIRL